MGKKKSGEIPCHDLENISDWTLPKNKYNYAIFYINLENALKELKTFAKNLIELHTHIGYPEKEVVITMNMDNFKDLLPELKEHELYIDSLIISKTSIPRDFTDKNTICYTFNNKEKVHYPSIM